MKKKTINKKSILSNKSKINKAIKDLKNDIDELKDKNKRLLAEFDNFKKRTAINQSDLLKYDGINLIRLLLPILDDFERTINLKELKKNKPIYSGIKMIYDKLVKSLEKQGVKSYNAVNSDFNPDLHEALMIKKTKKESNKVVEEFERGYKYHDKVIRHSKVVVSK